jgi:hypothetical protein
MVAVITNSCKKPYLRALVVPLLVLSIAAVLVLLCLNSKAKCIIATASLNSKAKCIIATASLCAYG